MRKDVSDDDYIFPNGQKIMSQLVIPTKRHDCTVQVAISHSAHASSANITPIDSVFKNSFKGI